MGRRSHTQSLTVWMNGERVGAWTITSRGEHQFAYAPDWLASPLRRSISLSMPLRRTEQVYRGEVVESFFENLLPDGRELRQQLMRRFGVARDDPFELLAEIGRDCIGAVQLLPPDAKPEDVRHISGVPLSTREVEARLRATHLLAPPAEEGDGEFRISLAGNQEKTALLRHDGKWKLPKGSTPTTHILKLPIESSSPFGVDLSDSVENEWLCAQILAGYGLPIAHCELGRFGAQRALIVERFDRRLSSDGSWIVRVPQEDFCQVTGTPPARKYESDGGPGIPRIMDLLLGSSHASADRADFFRAQFIFWLLCAIDGHAKNFSVFLEAGGGYRLTPLYDVLSVYPVLGRGARKLAPQKIKMAMAVSGRNRHSRWKEIRRDHFLETARRCGLADPADLMAEIIERTPQVIDSVGSKLPKDFPTGVSEPIFDGLASAAARAR